MAHTIVINSGTRKWIYKRGNDVKAIIYFSDPEKEISIFQDFINPLSNGGGFVHFEAAEESSAHSFTEGSEHAMKNVPQFDHRYKEMNDIMKEKLADAITGDMPHIPTIDDQVAWMKEVKVQYGNKATDPKLSAIIHNLQSIKRWNESPAYHGKVDVEKVIEDLVKDLRPALHLGGANPNLVASIQNAEAALGMLQAFKGERTITPQDVADAHHAGKNILDRKVWSEPYITQAKRDELHLQIVRLINAGWNAGSIANAIIYAIEGMDRLRQKPC